MLPTICHDLPGLIATCGPNDRECEEVLAKKPAGTGPFHWVQVAKTNLGTQQVRAALARSVNADPALVACAGHRDRQGRCIQWFSIPVSAVDHPGPLRRAGVQGKMRVLTINASHKPVGPETIERLKWTFHLRGGSAQDGYLRARAIVDRLRRDGFPNYLLPRQVGEDGGLARWGRLMVEGRRLPAQVAAKTDPSRYLRALQEELFNDWLGRRVIDGLLATCLTGDLVRGNTGDVSIVTDPVATAKRLASWEAMVLGPLFGNGMAPAATDALAREQTVLSDAGLNAGQVARLRGDRRAARAQPAKTVVDRDKADVVITCELPIDTYVEAMLAEVLRSESAPEESLPEELSPEEPPSEEPV